MAIYPAAADLSVNNHASRNVSIILPSSYNKYPPPPPDFGNHFSGIDSEWNQQCILHFIIIIYFLYRASASPFSHQTLAIGNQCPHHIQQEAYHRYPQREKLGPSGSFPSYPSLNSFAVQQCREESLTRGSSMMAS